MKRRGRQSCVWISCGLCPPYVRLRRPAGSPLPTGNRSRTCHSPCDPRPCSQICASVRVQNGCLRASVRIVTPCGRLAMSKWCPWTNGSLWFFQQSTNHKAFSATGSTAPLLVRGATLINAARSQPKLRGNSEPHATAETWRAMAQICMRRIKIAVELCRCLFKIARLTANINH